MWKYLFLIGSVSAFVIPHSNIRAKNIYITADGPILLTPYVENGDIEDASNAHVTADGPLLLTPYIENGDIEEARNLALVTGITPNITSYSGYLTVDKSCGSHIFFWFFPSQNDWLNDPVSVWLQGGPGASSFLGLLGENGPMQLTLEGELRLNEYSWHKNSSVIYIDNPVGTGFSFTENSCYLTDQDQVGQALLNVLVQFFQLFPELKPLPFYITGESYAGKYVPALGHAIHNSENKSGINFQGVAIGNGWTDPINQLLFSDYFYQLGLIDDNAKETMRSIEAEIAVAIEEGNYTLATILRTELMLYFGETANYTNFYNFLNPIESPIQEIIRTFLAKDEVKNALHVGNTTYDSISMTVFLSLFDDFMKSVKPWVEELLNNDYRVVLYNGQLDIVVPYRLTVNYVKKLEWKGAEDYKKAERDFWFVEEKLAGYSKTVGKFTEILVRNAGHMVPIEQPKWALDMYNRIIFNVPLKN